MIADCVGSHNAYVIRQQFLSDIVLGNVSCRVVQRARDYGFGLDGGAVRQPGSSSMERGSAAPARTSRE
jgi:hypothetical protein